MEKELEKEIYKKWEADARTLHNLQEDEMSEDSLDDLDGEWIFEETTEKNSSQDVL